MAFLYRTGTLPYPSTADKNFDRMSPFSLSLRLNFGALCQKLATCVSAVWKDCATKKKTATPPPPPLSPFIVFQRQMSSKFIGRAMNRDDALWLMPSVCTTIATMAVDVVQVMCDQGWTSVRIADITCRLSRQCRQVLIRTQGVRFVKSNTEAYAGF